MPRTAQRLVNSVQRQPTPVEPDMDRPLLEALAASPEFGALLEHFREERDSVIADQKNAVLSDNAHLIGVSIGAFQVLDGAIRWLTKYAPKENL